MEKRITHYNSGQKILLVGEGDFSFAACLAHAFGSAQNMVATSLDSKEMLLLLYSGVKENLEKLKELGCTIIHEVDAHTMNQHPRLPAQLFDRIIFNFPHAGFFFREHTQSQIELHKEVVKGFFETASKMLTYKGEIHVTHKTAHPFNRWDIETLAEDVGLSLKKKVPFSIWEYPRYQNKRGHGLKTDITFPIGECSTFMFHKLRDSHEIALLFHSLFLASRR